MMYPVPFGKVVFLQSGLGLHWVNAEDEIVFDTDSSLYE